VLIAVVNSGGNICASAVPTGQCMPAMKQLFDPFHVSRTVMKAVGIHDAHPHYDQ